MQDPCASRRYFFDAMPRPRWARLRRRQERAGATEPVVPSVSTVIRVTPRYKPFVLRHPHLIFVAALTGVVSGVYLFGGAGSTEPQRSRVPRAPADSTEPGRP